MFGKNLFSQLLLVLLTFVFLMFFSSVALSQQGKITINCIAEDTPDEVKKDSEKDKKTSAKKEPRLIIDRVTKQNVDKQSDNTQNLGEDPNIVPLGCTAKAYITVWNGPPNYLANYYVTQSNPENIVGMRRFSSDPFSSTVTIPIQLDGNGNGVSALFDVKGLLLGETILSGESSFNSTTPLYIIVVECKCPVIPVNIPPRN